MINKFKFFLNDICWNKKLDAKEIEMNYCLYCTLNVIMSGTLSHLAEKSVVI